MLGRSEAASVVRFTSASRINRSITGSVEKRLLEQMARRAPAWLSSDQLTTVGLVAQIAAGCSYALARNNRLALGFASAFIVLNWFGDSMDGTLARVRMQQRPRYGFYVDHVVDMIGAVALMCGLGYSGLAHWQVSAAMLVAFLLLSGESYLASYTLSRFELSQGIFGPTEIRLLLIAANLVAVRKPIVSLLGHRLLLFDVGGAVSAAAMAGLFILLTMRHTSQLYREEPLP